MNDLAQLECLKLGCVFLTSADIIIASDNYIALRDRYQATGTVKDRRRSGQTRIATGVKRQLTSIGYRRY